MDETMKHELHELYAAMVERKYFAAASLVCDRIMALTEPTPTPGGFEGYMEKHQPHVVRDSLSWKGSKVAWTASATETEARIVKAIALLVLPYGSNAPSCRRGWHNAHHAAMRAARGEK